MLIEGKALKHWIDHFYGYGSWHARIWLIGYEERGGDVPEEVAGKLNYFYNAHASTTGATLCDRHAAPSASSGDTWKNLIAFVHGYRNELLPDLPAYQKDSFVLPSAQREALIRLYPLPSPHNHAWYYSWLDLPQFGFLKSRMQYQQHVYQDRMQQILDNVSVYKPEVVLMYGMDNINTLKKSVQAFFHTAKFKMIKATSRQIPQHHRADLNGTTLVITTQIPALRHNRIETGFDWQEFGKQCSLRTNS